MRTKRGYLLRVSYHRQHLAMTQKQVVQWERFTGDIKKKALTGGRCHGEAGGRLLADCCGEQHWLAGVGARQKQGQE